MAVVASVSVASVEQARSSGRAVATRFAVPTVLLVTLLIDVVTRRTVHRPIAELQRTIGRVSAGDVASRAVILRRDELGSVAEGLNEMLGRLEHASDLLQQRVRDATSELLVRNAELEESYQRVLGLQEALARAERLAAVGEMAASVAHQVGTPLNLVSGYVQMVRDDPQTDPSVRQRLEIVESQLRQVTHVLRTMLDEARQPAPRITTSLAPLVERACAIARPRLARSGVQLDVQLDDTLPEVDANEAQLELALLNLISNALDAMPGGGELRVHGTASALGVRLEVSDSGPGIPSDLLPHLFEPWVTTKPAGHGTGLGLSIVREVLRGLGGEIRAANQPGGGAVFVIDLPRSAARRVLARSCARLMSQHAYDSGCRRRPRDVPIHHRAHRRRRSPDRLRAGPGGGAAPSAARARRSDGVGHQPQRLADRPGSAASVQGRASWRTGPAHQRFRHARDGD